MMQPLHARTRPVPLRHALGFLLVLALLLPVAARAQAPAWAAVAYSAPVTGTSVVRGTTADAQGNVFVTGSFSGQLAFGTTVLTSAGNDDLFVAKYVSGTDTWAWALRGGGTDEDQGAGIAVSGASVYVTGYISNTAADARRVRFGGTGATAGTVQQNGTSPTDGQDLVVAKYTDQGSSAALNWTQVGGGTATDQGTAIAVNGASVYVTGFILNTLADGYAVRFGGTGTTPGTVPQHGASTGNGFDIVVAKYTDRGATATLGWTQVGGGTAPDQGAGIAVNGTSVYVTGYIFNSTADGRSVRFGGAGPTPGTVPQLGASATNGVDLVVAKYTDNGATATLGWTQVGGGTMDDRGTAIAVRGTSVYVTGTIANNTADAATVRLGGAGLVPAAVPQLGASSLPTQDLVVAKYTDNGATATLGWTQVGGGTVYDWGLGIAVSGARVYVTGYIFNTTTDDRAVRFGGTGTTLGTVPVPGASSSSSADVVVAQYTDNGATASLGWTQVGGGTLDDWGRGVALSGQSVLAGGFVEAPARFGGLTTATPFSTNTAVLARLVDPGLPLGAGHQKAPVGLALYPNPALNRRTTLTGTLPGTVVRVFDVLGRPVTQATATAGGTAHLVLQPGRANGVYLVRAGTRALRLILE